MGKMKFGEKAKNPKKTFLRLMKDVFEGRYFLIVLIVLGIVLSAWATTYSASFIGDFIDDVVIPLKGNPKISIEVCLCSVYIDTVFLPGVMDNGGHCPECYL